MAFRDYSNNDPFDRDRQGFERDPRAYDNRSDWERGSDRDHRSHDRYDNQRADPRRSQQYDDVDQRYMAQRGNSRGWGDEDDPYIRDQRRLRERGQLQRGRDYGYAGSNYYYQNQRSYDPRDQHWGSENVDAQQNYERDRPNFRGGGWDQGESMRSRHVNGDREMRDTYEQGSRNFQQRDRGRYSSDPNAWSSMEHDWNGDQYYGGGSNRTGDYGSRGEEFNWRDNFGNDRYYSREGRARMDGDRSRGYDRQ